MSSNPPRILIVDDEPHIVQVVSLKLRNAGYDVITAADGEEALELALAKLPALVITDLQMPYMTGVQLCRALRERAATAAIPVVMLTARGYTLDDSDLAIGTIRKVLSKPFSPRAVLQLVENLLAECGHAPPGSSNDDSPSGVLPLPPRAGTEAPSGVLPLHPRAGTEAREPSHNEHGESAHIQPASPPRRSEAA